MKTPEKYDNNDCNFDDWWDYVLMVYGKGWLAAPIIGFDEEAYERGEYKVYVPSLQEVEDFRNNVGLKDSYRKLYDEGESVEMAFAIMY